MSIEKFKNPYRFEDFKHLAIDPSLSKYEKIGFPDSYRAGKEEAIFDDIISKLQISEKKDQILLDIGPGCSDLPNMIHQHAFSKGCAILLVDAQEMLDLLPSNEHTTKYTGQFPDQVPELLINYQNRIDYIVSYSTLLCVFYDNCLFRFIDAAVSLLKPGGRFLIGDVPNISRRKRFFSSEAGKQFHKDFMNTNEDPEVHHAQLEPGQIDDGVIFGILQRYRGFGFDTFLLPQNESLPFANRREDILIVKN
jgi:SAM-dependent methyltransferase